MTRSALALWFSLLPSLAAASGRGPAFACDMLALTKEERVEHARLAGELFAAVEARRELPAGYALRLPAGRWLDAARWAALERRCCPFFAFELSAGADGGPVWLRITGRPGAKAFMRQELGL